MSTASDSQTGHRPISTTSELLDLNLESQALELQILEMNQQLASTKISEFQAKVQRDEIARQEEIERSSEMEHYSGFDAASEMPSEMPSDGFAPYSSASDCISTKSVISAVRFPDAIKPGHAKMSSRQVIDTPLVRTIPLEHDRFKEPINCLHASTRQDGIIRPKLKPVDSGYAEDVLKNNLQYYLDIYPMGSIPKPEFLNRNSSGPGFSPVPYLYLTDGDQIIDMPNQRSKGFCLALIHKAMQGMLQLSDDIGADCEVKISRVDGRWAIPTRIFASPEIARHDRNILRLHVYPHQLLPCELNYTCTKDFNVKEILDHVLWMQTSRVQPSQGSEFSIPHSAPVPPAVPSAPLDMSGAAYMDQDGRLKVPLTIFDKMSPEKRQEIHRLNQLEIDKYPPLKPAQPRRPTRPAFVQSMASMAPVVSSEAFCSLGRKPSTFPPRDPVLDIASALVQDIASVLASGSSPYPPPPPPLQRNRRRSRSARRYRSRSRNHRRHYSRR